MSLGTRQFPFVFANNQTNHENANVLRGQELSDARKTREKTPTKEERVATKKSTTFSVSKEKRKHDRSNLTLFSTFSSLDYFTSPRFHINHWLHQMRTLYWFTLCSRNFCTTFFYRKHSFLLCRHQITFRLRFFSIAVQMIQCHNNNTETILNDSAANRCKKRKRNRLLGIWTSTLIAGVRDLIRKSKLLMVRGWQRAMFRTA